MSVWGRGVLTMCLRSTDNSDVTRASMPIVHFDTTSSLFSTINSKLRASRAHLLEFCSHHDCIHSAKIQYSSFAGTSFVI